MTDMLKTTTLNAREHFKVAHALDQAKATLSNAAALIERCGDIEVANDMRAGATNLRDASDLLRDRMFESSGGPIPSIVRQGRPTSEQVSDRVSSALVPSASEDSRKTA